MHQYTLTVRGMTCGHCEKAVTEAIRSVDPQAQVIIDRAHDTVTVDTHHTRDALATAIVEAGYDVLM